MITTTFRAFAFVVLSSVAAPAVAAGLDAGSADGGIASAGDGGAPGAPVVAVTPALPPAPATVPAPPFPSPLPPDGVQQTPGGSVGVDAIPFADQEPEVKQRKGRGRRWRDNGRDEGREGPYGALELSGRVISQAEYISNRQNIIDGTGTATPTTVRSIDLSVPSARLQAHYQTPVEWLSAKIEIDIAGNPDMKDGYVQAKGRHFAARLGQFKMPVAAIETESPWVLPLARRGMIHDLLVDWLDYGGRRPGALFSARGRGGIKPRVSLGAFQGSALQSVALNDRDTDPLLRRSLSSQSLIARGQVEVAQMDIGAYYEYRVGSPSIGQTTRYWTAGADLTIDRLLESGGVRVWADVLAGASWYRQGTDSGDTTFMVGRLLVAYRWGGMVPDAPYFEPYGFFGLFDPDTGITSDLAFETAVGFNVGYYHRARLTVQGEINRADRNFPRGYFASQDPDRLGLIVEAGVAF